jgi:two-component system, chemotaxis family, chemotaxis protein CheY
MKILLVDDDAFLRDMYATKFTQSGDTVSAAEDGTAALITLRAEQFDVILMDMVMPSMTGLELLEKINAENLRNGARCIILSNQSESSDLDAAKALGADGYIVKAELIPSEVVTKVHAIAK